MPTTYTRCQPDRIIKKSPQWEITRHRDGDTADIIETILYADTRSADFVLPGVDCLIGSTEYKTLGNIWAFVKNSVAYRADRPGKERIKSPGALFTSGYGDCKSFSITTGAILRALGIPYRYRFAAYEPGDFTHVYVVAESVNGDVILDSVFEKFDDEHPYHHHKDIKPSARGHINGIGAGPDKSDVFIAFLFGWLIGKTW